MGPLDRDLFELDDLLAWLLTRARHEVKLYRGVGACGEVQQLALFVEVSVHLLEDKLIDDKAFAPSLPCLAVFVDCGNDRLLIGDHDPGDVFDILLFRDIDDFVGAIFVENEEFVEVGALELDGA